MPQETGFWTIDDIAREVGIPYRRCVYIMREFGVDPIGRVGKGGVYSSAAVGRVRAALEEVGRARRSCRPGHARVGPPPNQISE